MSNTETFYWVLIWTITIASIVLNKFQDVLIKQQKKKLDQIYQVHKENEELYDEILAYCMTDIMNKQAERQDFESAEKCRKLLIEINVRRAKVKIK